MKKTALLLIVTGLILLCGVTRVWASEIDVLLTKLVEKNVLTPAEAQIIADETKVQVAKDLSQGQSISAPDWTQRVKWGGDVRFRTQGDWGKNANNQPATGATGGVGSNNTTDLREQRIRERIRGRFWMEGKVNDFTTAGVRFSGGGNSRNSTNDTLGNTTNIEGSSAIIENYFRKAPVMFDQYWIRFDAPSEMIRTYGQFFSDLKLWFGRMPIPFNYSELVWDSDINPGGIALQYTSPDIKAFGNVPSVNVYSNLGMFWLDESANINTDPLLFGYQIGLKTEAFGPLDSTVDISTAWYDFANMQNKSPAGAGTNSRWQIGELGSTYPAGGTLLGTDRYEYNVFDLLITVDNNKIGDWEFPHGFYSDFIYNPSAGSENAGALIGGYIGKKKIKVPGDWKARAEWRYIERDSVPDFMPDSDFYGFGTYIAGKNQNVNGIPAEGGTNGKGINLAFEYQLFKNTALNFEYYHMEPIKSWDKTCPWDELQIDLNTKF